MSKIMKTRISENFNGHLKALSLNFKDGLIMTVRKIDDLLSSRGYKIHFYALKKDDFAGLSLKDSFIKATNLLTEGRAMEYWNAEVYFYKYEGNATPSLHDANIVMDLDLYGSVMYHSKHMMKGFFGSNGYRDFVKSHDRKAQLRKKLEHEEEAVSRHQKKINALKQQIHA